MGNKEFGVDNGVYPPSEDSRLLLENIEVAKYDSVLEMGSGSGYLTVALADRVKRIVAVDISLNAVINTKRNLANHSSETASEVFQGDLLGAISPKAKFSVVIFNPPYLPADEDVTNLDHALIGGEQGTELAERFIEQSVEHLVENGRIYILVSSLGKPERVEEVFKKNGFNQRIIAKVTIFFETLMIYLANR